MTGVWHPTGRARVSARSPSTHAICDRCGFRYLHSQLSWQLQWAGVKLQNLRILVCCECLDTPQPQLKSIIIPADPVPVLNPRPEQYDVTVPNYLEAENQSALLTEAGQAILWEITDTPLPDPNNPALYPPEE